MFDVKPRLQDIFRRVFDKEDMEIYDSITAKNIEEWDSLMHIRLIVAIEKEFAVKFTVTELARLKDVGDTIKLIKRKLK